MSDTKDDFINNFLDEEFGVKLNGLTTYDHKTVKKLLKSYADQEVKREKRELLEKDYTPLIFRIAKEYSPDDPLERHHFIIGAMQVLNKLKEQ